MTTLRASQFFSGFISFASGVAPCVCSSLPLPLLGVSCLPSLGYLLVWGLRLLLLDSPSWNPPLPLPMSTLSSMIDSLSTCPYNSVQILLITPNSAIPSWTEGVNVARLLAGQAWHPGCVISKNTRRTSPETLLKLAICIILIHHRHDTFQADMY